jgi:uncharacterized linocin/CFP29 family protein
MDLLRRKKAPLADEAWKLIDEQAKEVLAANLSARKIVDVSGPRGWEFAAVNLGRLEPGTAEVGAGVTYGIRKVLPLVEVRVPFTLDLRELDDAGRGALDPDLQPLVEAARRIAGFEERAIYYGFAPGGIVGMATASGHAPVALGREPRAFAESVARAIVALRKSGEEAGYALVVGPSVFEMLESEGGGYPPRKQIGALIGGPILLSPFVDTAFLVPAASKDDFELSIGQDLAVGYDVQDGTKIRLYLTESFTFRVIEPLAVVHFTM